jgi:hypothetical protein
MQIYSRGRSDRVRCLGSPAKVSRYVLALILILLGSSHPASGQIDLSGEWAARYHEDQLERIPGPDIGDYLGIPINDDLRLRADSWDASLLTLLEHECIPHPATYATRGPAEIRIDEDIDFTVNPAVVKAIVISGTFGGATRTVWMDGRPHPPEWALHTWAGFSSGHWEGETLVVETTHIKAGYLRRNGVITSDEATVLEYWSRHGDVLTALSIREDPIYLTEPFVQSSNWVIDPVRRPTNFAKCIPVEEIVGRKRGYVPHHLPGSNTLLEDFANRFSVPFEATRGGAETMYPEYRLKLKNMPRPPPKVSK